MSHLCVYISWPLQPSDWKRPMPGGPSWSKADCSCQTLEKMGPLSSDSSLGQRWEALRQPPFLVVNQIAMHGRDASWAVDTIWTFGKTCQDYHGITLWPWPCFINYLSVSHQCRWGFFISHEWSSQPKIHNHFHTQFWQPCLLCLTTVSPFW